VWDSGKQPSAESSLVVYAGPPLRSAADYYWKVRTWDQKNRKSEWSAPASWGMGLLSPADWKARWIDSGHDGYAAPLFRSAFHIYKKVRRAKVFICGLGYFELYVNGSRIGDDCLVPNFTNYTRRVGLENAPIALSDNFSGYRAMYLGYDVTDRLLQGRNAVGVVLGRGFYESDGPGTARYGRPCLLCQLEITYDDGTTSFVVSDDTWLTKPSAIVFNDIYRGETYDATAETPDWCQPRCDETSWRPAGLAAAPCGQLSAHAAPTDKVTEKLEPVAIRRLGSNSFEVDFGKEISGWIRFSNVSGHRGDTLSVRYVSESPQGSQLYMFKGMGEESYAPRFTWFVFSRAIVSGVDSLSTSDIRAEAVNTRLPFVSEFRTSNPLFDRINDIWRRSQLDNMHGGIASDCPHRERLPYTGDGQAACATVMHNFDAAAFYQKWIRDIRDAQNPDNGYVPNSAPWQPRAGGGVAWGAAVCIMPWEYYVQYGDRKMLLDTYESMKGYVSWLLRWRRPDGTIFQQHCNVGDDKPNYWLNLGDWCPPYGHPADDLVHTFYLWQCADITARAAAVLGRESDHLTYRDMADDIRKAFHKRYYDSASGSYGDFGSNIFALVMGVPDDCYDRVVDALRNEIVVTHGGHIDTGFLATKYFFETLSDHGLHDVAFEAMNKRDFPGFGWWIEQGATTTWEQWDGVNSRNHPMFGGGLTWFYRRLAGVCADERSPGYRHIVIRPFISDRLDYVSYSYMTPYGEVVSSISRTPSGRRADVVVPVGSSATLYLPASSADAVKESGRPLRRSKGVSVDGCSDGMLVLSLVQGAYSFGF